MRLVPMDEELIPKTRFATLGEDRIAYQVFGEGEMDLLLASTLGDGIDTMWYWPPYAAFLRRLGAMARVIKFDPRGTGASDAPSGEGLPGWEEWADEARAVLDAVASAGAVLVGQLWGGATVSLFAASHPGRTRGLILWNAVANYTDSRFELAEREYIEHGWGSDALVEFGNPDASRDPSFLRWCTMAMRQSVRRRDVVKMLELNRTIDFRAVLPSIQVPTLVLQREGFQGLPSDAGQRLAEAIPHAMLDVVAGNDGVLYTEPSAEVLGHFEQFLGQLRAPVEPTRTLAAILFTDIVGATATASALGDREWTDLLERHDAAAQNAVQSHRGRIVKTTGDGLLATFDGPGRAIQCAKALGNALRPLGIDIRAGLHTGEVEVREDDIAGIGVHIAARVLQEAQPGEVWVSGAVPMLVAGSGLDFEDRGEFELKGVPGRWRLFALAG